jgi:uncharacterized membrane protein
MGLGGAAPGGLISRFRAGVTRWWAWGAKSDDAPIYSSIYARVAAAAAVGLSFGLWTTWATHRHRAFGTFGFDFGIFDQGMWLLSRFKSPFITIMGVHLFGDHTSFILLPLVPFYWLFPSAEVLIVAQALALAIAAVPLFLLARDKLRNEWLAAGVAVAFLLNPALHWEGWEQFHPDVFEVPLALFALYFMTKRRWWLYFVFVILLLSVKEDVALMTVMLGLYVAVKHDRNIGIATSLISLAWFASSVWVVLPAFNGEGTLDAWRIPYGGWGGLLKAAVTKPWDVIGLAFSEDRKWYVWQLFISFGLLSLLAPSAVLIAAGPFASNLLSTFWYQYHLQYHYTTLIVAVLAFAAVVGLAHIGRFRLRAAAVVVWILAAAVTGWMWGPSQFARHPEFLGDANAAHVAPIHEVLGKVPKHAAVAAQYSYITHLDHREEIYEFPVPWYQQNWGDGTHTGDQLIAESARVRYIVVPVSMAPRETALIDHLTEREFKQVISSGGVRLFKRVAPAKPIDPVLAQRLRDLAAYE